MKIAAVIAEYNPFHKGHLWQLQKLRERGASHLVVVMSPNFTQRGTPAIFPKRVRAAAALDAGADLVVELPTAYACAGAQGFAFGAVHLVQAMGCVDWLGFGAEDADVALLRQAAGALQEDAVRGQLQSELAKGITFAAAREQAVRQVCGDAVASVLQSPNNILAVEYLTQLEQLAATVEPVALERVGNAHDGAPVEGYASASFLRELLYQGRWEQAEPYLPQKAAVRFQQAAQMGKLAKMKNGERAVLSALRQMRREELALLPDLSEGIENRLYAASQRACSLDELYSLIKTKRYPLSRVRRLVLAAFLQMPGQAHKLPPPYLRVLAMNGRGREILSTMKRTASLPVSVSLKTLSKTSANAHDCAELEAACTDRYYSTFTQQIFPGGLDYTEPVVRIEDDFTKKA